MYLPNGLINNPENGDEVYDLVCNEAPDVLLVGESPEDYIEKRLTELGEDRVLEYYRKNV